MTETKCNREKNARDCACTYNACRRRGMCCQCVAYHRKSGEIPGCFFPPEIEATFDRSLKAFAEYLRDMK